MSERPLPKNEITQAHADAATVVLGGSGSAPLFDEGATVVMPSTGNTAGGVGAQPVHASTGTPVAVGQAQNALLANGTRLGEFEITALIGQGGFGAVYEAWDHVLERTVAIKEYLPNSLAQRQLDGAVAPVSERQRDTFDLGMRSFINEAKLLAQFDHPSLLKVYRFWEERGTTYMVMPLYRGRTLRQALSEKGEGVSEAWLLQMLDGVTQALSVMHAADCFHRDIAPDNIMLLEGSEHPVVLDLGAARRVLSDKTQAITVILKPGYAPIEQYAEMPDVKQGPWTDVYALAAVLHVAVCGKSPLPSVARVISDSHVPLAGNAHLRQRFSAPFLQAIDAGLAVRPENRPQSMQAFRGLLGLGDSTSLFAANAGVGSAAASAGGGGGKTPRAASFGGNAANAAAGAGGRAAGERVTGLNAQMDENSKGVLPKKWLFIGGGILILLIALIWGFMGRTGEGQGIEALPVDLQGTAASSSTTHVPSTQTSAVTDLPSVPAPAPVSPEQLPSSSPSPPTPPTPLQSLQALKNHAVPDFGVQAKPLQPRLQIGKDALAFDVSSQRAGYVYVYLLSSGGEMLMLFPNQLDRHNQIQPGETWQLPRAAWPMTAGGPAGVNEFAVVVSEQKRDFSETGAQSDGVFSQFSTSVLAALETASAGGASPLLGQAVCAQGSPCSNAYGVAFFSIAEE